MSAAFANFLRLRCWYRGHPDAAYFQSVCPRCGTDMEDDLGARSEENAMTPRYELIAEFLVDRIEDSKPSLSPDKYPDLNRDPSLLGFERGLERAQHIIRVSARQALTAATPKPGGDE